MSIRNKISKLLIPLYIFFLFSLIMSSLLSGFFELYSNMPFQEIARVVRDNSDSIRVLFEDIDDADEKADLRQIKAENTLEEEFGEDMTGVNEILARDYPIYQTKNPVGFMLLVIIVWLWPVYRYIFKGEGEAHSRVVSRVINLPGFLFILPWAAGLWGLFLKLYIRDLAGFETDSVMKANFIVTFFMYGSFAGFFNSWYSSRYINNGIARKVFKGNQLHSLKTGRSITLTHRILLLILSLGMIPLILNIYIPAVFNSWVLRSAFLNPDVDLAAVGQILGPLVITSIVNLVFIIAQLSSIISFCKKYTVIGDTVNVASRIESQTKVYETDILLSESTQKLLTPEYLKTIGLKKNEPVIVRGKTEPITLYSINH